MPKLIIITVNLNNAEGLRKTDESVIFKIFTDYEYIIIDGGSIGDSKEIIKNTKNIYQMKNISDFEQKKINS